MIDGVYSNIFLNKILNIFYSRVKVIPVSKFSPVNFSMMPLFSFHTFSFVINCSLMTQ